ncbi:MAG: autotransporter outer membrane beta-barrel domain-containing protein [Alphaproteobacteria bacterium]
MKLLHILLTSTAIASASLAYGQTISTATTNEVTIDSTDLELIITSAGSITIDNPAVNVSGNNAIYFSYGVDGTNIQNDGEINFIGGFDTSQYPGANEANNGIYTNGANNGTVNNTGLINISLIGEITSDSPGVSIYSSVNGINYTNSSNLNIINSGIITTNMDITSIGAIEQSQVGSQFRDSGNGIQTDYSSYNGNTVENYGVINASHNIFAQGAGAHFSFSSMGNGALASISTNDGLIIANSTLTQNTNSTRMTAGSGGNSFNGVYGGLTNNTGVVLSDLEVNDFANWKNFDYSTSYLDLHTVGNGVYLVWEQNMDLNDGIIAANATYDRNHEAIGTINLMGAALQSFNGVKGTVDQSLGVIRGHLDVTLNDSFQYSYGSGNPSGSANGIFGSLTENNGTVSSYYSPDFDHIETVQSNDAFGSAIGYFDIGGAITATNTGSLLGHWQAVNPRDEYAASNITFNNYGVMTGMQMYGRTDYNNGTFTYNDYESNMAAANNYGTYILIDENGDVVSIEQGTSGTDAYGRTSEQAAMVGTTDSYNVYTSETAITDTLLNGAGVASGVATLDGTADFAITNSSLNAYHTALDIRTTNRVDASDSFFNGGGLQNVMLSGGVDTNSSANPTSQYAVIKGDEQDNFLLVHGTSYINGDVTLGNGADIFVLDIENTTLNGTADLGDADDDTFALYTFTGTDAELTEATEDYAAWGMFNAYLGDKVMNYENIGAEIGLITMEDDLTAYGLYVGQQATADFTTNDAYALKNLRNDGIVNMQDDTADGHITISDYLKGTGTYIFDTDFATLTSDYITVNGNITANGIIAINDVTSADGTQSAGTHVITLIEAPNDSDKTDEDFNLADAHQIAGNGKQGRFTGSPYMWNLGNAGNDWVLTTDIKGSPTPPPPVVVPEIPAYVSLPTIGREMVMDELGRLHMRLGELRNNQGWVGTGSSNLKTNLASQWHNAIGFDDSRVNAWLKGTISDFDISSDNSFDVSGTYGGFNLGIDKKFDLGNHSPDWTVFAGLFGGYKTGDFETSGRGGQHTSSYSADVDINAWSIGGYATFFNTAGTYIDIVAQYMDFDADIDAAGLTSSTDGYALAGSVEVGHSFDLAKDWIIEPQAQVKIAHINWDDFNDGVNDVSFEDHTYVTGRAGVRVEKTIKTSVGEVKPWAYVGVLHEFTDAPNITYADTIFEAVDYNTAGEIKVGVTADIYKSVQIYADLGFATDFDDYHALKGDLGVRVSW